MAGKPAFNDRTIVEFIDLVACKVWANAIRRLFTPAALLAGTIVKAGPNHK